MKMKFSQILSIVNTAIKIEATETGAYDITSPTGKSYHYTENHVLTVNTKNITYDYCQLTASDKQQLDTAIKNRLQQLKLLDTKIKKHLKQLNQKTVSEKTTKNQIKQPV